MIGRLMGWFRVRRVTRAQMVDAGVLGREVLR